MGRNLERLVQKAKAARPKPRMVPANPLPIVGGRHAEVPERVDHLIAAGKLTEADRPRCVFWTDCPRPIGAMSVEQLAILEAQCEIARAKLPDRDAECSLALARILHCVGCPEEKSEIGDSLLECTPKMRHKNKGQFSRGERCPKGSAVSLAGSSSSRR